MGTHTNRVVTLAMGTGESLVANSNTIKKSPIHIQQKNISLLYLDYQYFCNNSTAVVR